MKDLKKWKADPSKGEVFTPIELVNLILDKIPSDVWTNPNSTFLDPCMGTGVFLIEIVRRLVYIYGYSELDAKSRVYGYEIRVKYINRMLRRGFLNVQHKDFLCDEIKMKFDVVIGNPPYQKKVGPRKTEAIWPKFVEKSFEICKEGGYVSLIHPNGWRNVDGNYKNVQNKIKSKNLIYLSINSVESGQQIFKVTTPFDWYLVQNCSNIGKNKIKFEDGNEKIIDLSKLDLIPNKFFDKIINLIAKKDEKTVVVLYSRSDYGSDKKHMSKTINGKNTYPCVYSILSNGNINLMYSTNKDKGHFGIPKVVVGNGANPTCFIDYEGKYGLTQFAFGIIDTADNLSKIEKVIKSKEFQKINLSTKYVATAGNPLIYPKIIKLFRKDFWKEFLDENGNVREL